MPRRRSALRTNLEYTAARIALSTLAHGPLALSNRLARLYVGILDRAIPRLRRVAQTNLRLALPNLSPEAQNKIIEGSFQSIARVLVALARIPQIGPQNISDWIRYEGFEHYQTAKARGKGVLFATAHLGNWELSAYAHAILTEPMHVVVRPLDNEKIDALITNLRTHSGNQVIGKKDYARGILRALSKNEAVGILIDQNAGLEDGIFVPFFNHPACVGTGFARIAAHSGAAIIPGFALWSEAENRYILKFEQPIYATGNLETDTAQIHAALEKAIRQIPHQWLWQHRRWKTRPPGGNPIY